MPIYEFFCADCNTVFNFLARTITTKKPACPKCQRPELERMVSTFATPAKHSAGSEGDEELPFDETKMEKAMRLFEKEAAHIDEDDPRQAAALIRKLSEAAGAPLGDGMQEALARMEAGEDPDKIETEMGDVLEQEGEAWLRPSKRSKRGQSCTPIKYDDQLYDLD